MISPDKALSAAAIRILRALVRIMMRYGMPYEGFAELAKRVYVEVAQQDFAIPGRKQSVSRISTLTGIYRREVSRLIELPAIDDADITARHNRAARVIGGWLQDPAYRDASGEVLVLEMNGEAPSFTHLVRKYSGDIPARAIRDELMRVGAIELVEDDRIRLLSRAYVPRHGEADMIAVLGTDVSDFIQTIDSRLQLKVAYDNLPEEAVREFQSLASKRGRELLEEFNIWLAARDRDINPESEGTGTIRAGFGVYYFEEGSSKESRT